MIKPGSVPIVIYRRQPTTISFRFRAMALEARDVTWEARAETPDVDPLLEGAVEVTDSVVDGVNQALVEVTVSRAAVDALDEPLPLGSDLVARHGLKIDGVVYVLGPLTIKDQANHA